MLNSGKVGTSSERANVVFWTCILLVVITLTLYGRVQNFDFIKLDDEQYVSDNKIVQKGFTREGLIWALTGTQLGNWHPLTTFSFLLTSQFFGMSAGAFHLVNLGLHAATTLMVFVVLRKLTGKFWRSAIVAGLFGWHPLHVESVAWVSERKDVLSGLFWFLTIWAYAEFAEGRRWRYYALSLVFFGLGLVSKPMVVTLPCVLLLLDYWPLQRWQAGARANLRLLLEKGPYFAFSLASSVVTFIVQRKGGTVATLEYLSIWDRVANAAVSYQRYLEKTLLPINLSVIYPHPGSWPWWRVACGFAVVFVVTAFAIRLRRRAPFFVIGWLWYLGTLVPVIGLVQVGSQAMADRYSYLPLVGVFMMVVWGASEWVSDVDSRQMAFGGLLAGVALAVCLTATTVQLSYWRNSVTLFAHAIAVTKDNGYAHRILGDALKVDDRLEVAMVHYREVTRIYPNDPDAHFQMGLILAKQGKVGEAALEYKETLRLAPGNADAHHNLGNILIQQSQWKDAAAHYLEVIRWRPGSEVAENNLATCLVMQGQMDAAVNHYLEAIRINPNYESAYYNLGLIHVNQGRNGEAIACFKAALRINPESVQALDRLAWVLATSINPDYRDGAQAVRLAQRACELTRQKHADLLDTLAAAYAEAGRFSDAVNSAEMAVALASNSRSQRAIHAIRLRLAMYRSGEAFHDNTLSPQQQSVSTK